MTGRASGRPRPAAATRGRAGRADRGERAPKESGRRGAFLRALAARDEISITVKGRRTGKAITLPVWFVLDGDTLWLLPVRGSRSQWFRNVQADPTLTIKAGGARRTFSAKPARILKVVRTVVRKFRARYGAADVARYYSGFDSAVRVPLEDGRTA